MEAAVAVSLDQTVVPQIIVDEIAQGAGAPAVVDLYRSETGDEGVVDIFIQHRQGLHGIHAVQVQGGFHADALAEGHVRGGVAAAPAAALLDGRVLLAQTQIGQRRFHLDHAQLDRDLAVLVRQGHHAAVLVQAGQKHGFAQPHLFRCLAGEHRSGRFLFQLLAQGFQLALRFLPGLLRGFFLRDAFLLLLEQGAAFGQGVVDDTLGLFVGPTQHFGLFGGQLLLLFPQPLFPAGGGRSVGRGLFLFRGKLPPHVFQIGQHGGHRRVVAGKIGRRFFDDAFRQAQPAADLEGVGFARHAHEQAEGGRQGGHVELHAGVDEAGRVIGEGLELAVMSGGHGLGPQGLGVLQDGHGQGRALGGVGAGAQFVEEQQGTAVGLTQDIHDIGHVGAEGGQALFDALLVSDIGADPVEAGYLAALIHRDMQSGQSHASEEADGLQGHGLAAGVGPGDDHGGDITPQLHVDGHHPGRRDQWMAGLDQADEAAVVDLGSRSVKIVAELAFGRDEIDAGQHDQVGIDLRRKTGDHQS